MERDYAEDRLGEDMICHDWSRVYNELDKNFKEWEDWRAEWN